MVTVIIETFLVPPQAKAAYLQPNSENLSIFILTKLQIPSITCQTFNFSGGIARPWDALWRLKTSLFSFLTLQEFEQCLRGFQSAGEK